MSLDLFIGIIHMITEIPLAWNAFRKKKENKWPFNEWKDVQLHSWL
jgi:hypothetical protein